MKKTVLLGMGFSMALGACVSATPPPEDAEPIRRAPAGTCDADPVQYHIGHTATQDMGAAILAESGASTLRWGPPESAWTMDYRKDRVNVRYDADMKIIAITCG